MVFHVSLSAAFHSHVCCLSFFELLPFVSCSSAVVCRPSFASDSKDASDCDGHGTHIASTAVGRVVGVAKEASLVAVRVLDCKGAGQVCSWTPVALRLNVSVSPPLPLANPPCSLVLCYHCISYPCQQCLFLPLPCPPLVEGMKKKKNKTKQNKTKQNKTKQNKTKQNKTKQNKTTQDQEEEEGEQQKEKS